MASTVPIIPYLSPTTCVFTVDRLTWKLIDWIRIAYNCKYSFELNPNDQRIRVWRCPEGWNTYYLAHNQKNQYFYVRGHFIWHQEPYFCHWWIFTARHCVDDIMCPLVLHFFSWHPELTFQQDNVRSNVAIISADYLCVCETFPWPGRSPQRSLIEEFRGVMSRYLRYSQDSVDLTRVLETI